MKVKAAQSCPTLCNLTDHTVHGILQARILECVAFPFSRGYSQPRDQTQISHIAGRFFTNWATRKPREVTRVVLSKLLPRGGRKSSLYVTVLAIGIYLGKRFLELPWWLSGKGSTCQCRRCGFDSWIGKIPWRRKWQPSPVFLPGKFCGEWSLMSYSPWSHKRVGHDLATKEQVRTQRRTCNIYFVHHLMIYLKALSLLSPVGLTDSSYRCKVFCSVH